MNLLIITGNLTEDCTLRYTPSEKAVCNFSVAVNVGFDDNKRTEYYRCALWGKRAEGKLPQYLTKGQKVLVKGDPRQDKYENKGKEYFDVKVFVQDIELLGSGGGAKDDRNDGRQASAAAGQSSPQAGTDDFDDSEIPF